MHVNADVITYDPRLIDMLFIASNYVNFAWDGEAVVNRN
jgi:hypothetical protein